MKISSFSFSPEIKILSMSILLLLFLIFVSLGNGTVLVQFVSLSHTLLNDTFLKKLNQLVFEH